jgi:uncharacterized membrane protein YcaP (DUF421 family)
MSTGAALVTVFLHTMALYAFLIVCLSLLSRREIAQLTEVEFTIILLLGSAVETSMVAGNTSLAAGLVSAGTLLLVNRLLTIALKRSRWLRRIVVGVPLVIVHDGRLVSRNLRRAGLTADNVSTGLRERGYADLDEVRYAVLEIDGSLGVIPTDAPIHRGPRALKRPSGEAPGGSA